MKPQSPLQPRLLTLTDRLLAHNDAQAAVNRQRFAAAGVTVVNLLSSPGSGKTALLENFVSNKTRRKFKAFLAYDKKEGKVVFEFEPRAPRAPAKKAAAKKSA